MTSEGRVQALEAQLAAVAKDRRRIVEVTDRLNRDRLRDIADLHERLADIAKEANRGLANGKLWLADHAEFVLENIVEAVETRTALTAPSTTVTGPPEDKEV